MPAKKLTFNVDEVERLQTKIRQVSQDTNRLYLQLKGQASNWSGIPLGSNQVQAQIIINELTVEAEKLEDIIRGAIKGVQGAQDENKRQANQLFQQLGVLGGMFERFGGGSAIGKSSTPTTAQKAVTNLITSVATLMGWDELSRDPMVQKLQATVKNAGLGTIDSIAAQSKLKDIYLARDQIAKAQTAYKVYQTFGNQAQMDAMHKLAEDARKKLESMGVDAVQYQVGKDLSGYFKQAAVKSCDYDPSITTKSVPLMENEKYAFLLRMSTEKGTKGDWAKQQLAMMKPQSTIGPYDPHDFVSDEDILNRNNPEVIKRLQGTYWFDLSIEEQDRRFAETKAYYEKHEKEVADKNRLLGSGVGNQTIANILEGGSSVLTHAIDTASFGMAGTITDWIVGPKLKGYVDPMDDPYGKKAGQFAGQLISIGLPFKYLKAVKTPGMLGKFSPTLLRSMVSGAISGTVGEAFDAFNDYRDDGNQSLGERIGAVGVNTVIAGVGDAAITAGSKLFASTIRFVRGKLPELKVDRMAGRPKVKIEFKVKEIKEPYIEGTGIKGIDPPPYNREEILRNIEQSKKAREASNFDKYLQREKELLEKLNKGMGKGGHFEIEKILTDSTSKRALEILSTESKKSRGPCLSGIYDPVTQKTFFGQNFKTNATMRQEYQKWLTEDADPIIKDLVKEYELKIKSGEIKLSEVADDRLAAHSELRALDQVLKARKEMGLPVNRSTLSELYLHNIDLTKSDLNNLVAKIRCEHCRYLTDGINTVGHN
jgi:hypothetical protein